MTEPRRHFIGVPTSTETHLTLAYLGTVEDEKKIQELKKRLSQIKTICETISLEVTGFVEPGEATKEQLEAGFKKERRTALIAPDSVPPIWPTMTQALLSRLGLKDLKKRFIPHITLSEKEAAPKIGETIPLWCFALYEYNPDFKEWEVIAQTQPVSPAAGEVGDMFGEKVYTVIRVYIDGSPHADNCLSVWKSYLTEEEIKAKGLDWVPLNGDIVAKGHGKVHPTPVLKQFTDTNFIPPYGGSQYLVPCPEGIIEDMEYYRAIYTHDTIIPRPENSDIIFGDDWLYATDDGRTDNKTNLDGGWKSKGFVLYAAPLNAEEYDIWDKQKETRRRSLEDFFFDRKAYHDQEKGGWQSKPQAFTEACLTGKIQGDKVFFGKEIAPGRIWRDDLGKYITPEPISIPFWFSFPIDKIQWTATNRLSREWQNSVEEFLRHKWVLRYGGSLKEADKFKPFYIWRILYQFMQAEINMLHGYEGGEKWKPDTYKTKPMGDISAQCEADVRAIFPTALIVPISWGKRGGVSRVGISPGVIKK